MFPVPAWLILAQALPSKNLQMQLCKREGTGKKMSQGRREMAGLDIGEDGPSPQNPEAVCILMLMLSRPPQPCGSQGTAVAGTRARVLSLLLLSPLRAENYIKGKKKKTQKTNKP